MKTCQLSAALLVAALVGTAGFAQAAATPAAPASAPATVKPAPAAPVAIDGYVYVDKLPTPTQLMSQAEAEHLTISRMDQTSDRIVAVYQYPDGRTRAFAYTTSEPVGTVATAAPAATATYTVVPPPVATEPTVVYAEPAPTVVYYESPRYVRYYDPAWDFWSPFAVGVGLGWGFGDHDHFHGGYDGGHHGDDGDDGDGGWRH